MKHNILMGVAAISALALGSVSSSDAVAQSIKVGAASNVGGMIVFVAQDKGFFAKHGLDAKVVVRNTGSALTKSLRAGEIDFAPAAFTNLPVALEKGIKLRGVVGYLGGHYSAPASDGNVGIIARPGSGIKSIKDLKGKTVGVAFGTTGDLYLQEVLRKNGLRRGDIKRINVRPPSHVSSLDSGGVQAVVAWEPNVTRALDKVKGSTLVVRGGGHVCFCAAMASVKLLIAQKKMKKPYDPAKYLDTSFIDSTIKRHPEWFSDLK
jgi:ABC-type nitrate/sulfonate/bicarbonate transport system substrate-binding protein